jgi:hypothetical protein
MCNLQYSEVVLGHMIHTILLMKSLLRIRKASAENPIFKSLMCELFFLCSVPLYILIRRSADVTCLDQIDCPQCGSLVMSMVVCLFEGKSWQTFGINVFRRSIKRIELIQHLCI